MVGFFLEKMDIKVLEIRLMKGEQPLRAFCDIQIEGWVIRDFRVIKQVGQRVFVSPPQSSWKDPNTGQVQFKGILTIPPEQKQRIDIEILSVFQREMEKLENAKKG
jgi:DNA-binding cell septation regulator SpoVG